MYDLKALLAAVRPITGGEDGLAALVFSTGGRLYSYYRNVLLSIETPEGFPSFCVKGDPLVKAATSQTKMAVSESRLTLTSGKLRTWLPLDTESLLPEPVIPTDFTQVPEDFIKTLVGMAKLVPEEAPRVWSTSLLVKGSYAYATDGGYIVRRKLNVQLPFECALPKSLVTVLAKLKKPLGTMAFDGHQLHITFNDGSRLSSPVYGESWPSVADFFMAQDMKPTPNELIEYLGQVKPFAEKGVLVDFEAPNVAKFFVRKDGVEAEACFEESWVSHNFTADLVDWVEFIHKGSQLYLGNKFAMIKHGDDTIILAAKTHA